MIEKFNDEELAILKSELKGWRPGNPVYARSKQSVQKPYMEYLFNRFPPANALCYADVRKCLILLCDIVFNNYETTTRRTYTRYRDGEEVYGEAIKPKRSANIKKEVDVVAYKNMYGDLVGVIKKYAKEDVDGDSI